MRTLVTGLYSILGMVLLFVLVINIIGTRADIVDGVTGDKIKQVKSGLTLEQVISILGRPYKINTSPGLHNIDCPNPRPLLNMDINNNTDIRQIVDNIYNDTNYCCDGNKQDMQTKGVTLTYTRPVSFSKYYPMLWVHLDSTFKVWNVYAKQYDGLLGYDDRQIYSLTATGIDINENKFADCFK